MESQAPTHVVIADYDISSDAEADLKLVDEAYWSQDLAAYEAALVVTDAWDQAHVRDRKSGAAVFLPAALRAVSEAALKLGNTMAPDSAAILAVAWPKPGTDVGALFARSKSVRLRTFDSGAAPEEDLARVLTSIMGNPQRSREGAKE